MLFDTHSHIQFKVFDKTRDQIIEDSKKAGIDKIIAVGTNLETSKKAIEVAKNYPEVFASVGIHPHHVFSYCHSEALAEESLTHVSSIKDPETMDSTSSPQGSEIPHSARNDIEKVESLISHPKVVAVGETGMDKHIYKKSKYPNYLISNEFINLQKIFFTEQIKLAIQYKKALIIHNREAISETLEVLEKNWDKVLERKAVFHMCEPNIRLLNFAKKQNVFISFGGDITYDKSKQEFLKKVPLDLLVLETDSPFFIPESSHGTVIPATAPFDGGGIQSSRHPELVSGSGSSIKSRMTVNEPAKLELIAQKIAETLGIDKIRIQQTTYRNSLELFQLSS